MTTGTNCLPNVYNVLKPTITASAVSIKGWSFKKSIGKLIIESDDGITAWQNEITDKSTIKEVEITNGVTSIGHREFDFVNRT